MALTVNAPEGAHFEFEEVKTAKGTQSLGEKPLLVWDLVDAVRSTFGDDGLKDILDGTSLRVSYQSISRRLAAAGKTDDEIAAAQVAFRPGKRQGSAITPAGRAKRAAASAAEKVHNPDQVTALLEQIASGALSEEDIEAIISSNKK